MVEERAGGVDGDGDVVRARAAEQVPPAPRAAPRAARAQRLEHLVRVELQQLQVADDQLRDRPARWPRKHITST